MKSENEKIERIILDSTTVAIVKTISDQINLELGDLVQVTQKCVANFILRKRFQLLSAQEMSEFLSENYDLVKALKHATQEAIKAKQSGDSIEISDVLKLIQTPSVKSELPLKKTRGRKKKLFAPATTNVESKQRNGLNAADVGSLNGDSGLLNLDSNLKKSTTLSTSESP